MTKPEWLSNDEAAEYIGVKPHTLEVWRSTGRHKIRYVKAGKLVKYRPPWLDEWLDSHTVDAESAQ